MTGLTSWATDMLIKGGYRVIAAVDAAQALAVLQVCADIQVLFTNATLPRALGGCALAKPVSRRWPGIGLLIVTGKWLAWFRSPSNRDAAPQQALCTG